MGPSSFSNGVQPWLWSISVFFLLLGMVLFFCNWLVYTVNIEIRQKYWKSIAEYDFTLLLYIWLFCILSQFSSKVSKHPVQGDFLKPHPFGFWIIENLEEIKSSVFFKKEGDISRILSDTCDVKIWPLLVSQSVLK